jgi:hypothetical protein
MKERTIIPLIVCTLYLSFFFHLSQCRFIVFEGKESSNEFTRPSDGVVEVFIGLESGPGESASVQPGLDSVNSFPQERFSFFSPISHPIIWAFKKFEEIEALQRSAVKDMILGQLTHQQEDLVFPQVESMLRRVGCQRYHDAMREYSQMASQHSDRAEQALQSDWMTGGSSSTMGEEALAALSSSLAEQQAIKEEQQLVYLLDSVDKATARNSGPFQGDLTSSSLLNPADDDDDEGWGGASIVLLEGYLNDNSNTQREEATHPFSQKGQIASGGEGMETLSQQHESQQLESEQMQKMEDAAVVSDAAAYSLLDFISQTASQGLQRSENSLDLLRGHSGTPHSASLFFPGVLNYDYKEPRDGDDSETGAAAALWSRKRADGRDASSTAATASDTFYALAGNTFFETVISLLDKDENGVVPQATLVQENDNESEENDVYGAKSLQQQKAVRAAGGSGLDVDFDGRPELMLLLVDPVTGDINYELVLLLVLLFCVAMMVANFVHSWVGLLRAMSRCKRASGQVLVPVWVLRNGQMVQENMLLKEGDDFGALEEVDGKIGAAVPCVKQGMDVQDGMERSLLPEVVVASEFAAQEQLSKL